jgi:hypothetical protein
VSIIGELLERKRAPVYKAEITAVGIRRADHATLLYSQNLALAWPTSGGPSVGMVRSRTQAMELLLSVLNAVLIIQCLSRNNVFFFNFTYPLRCFSVPRWYAHPRLKTVVKQSSCFINPILTASVI